MPKPRLPSAFQVTQQMKLTDDWLPLRGRWLRYFGVGCGVRVVAVVVFQWLFGPDEWSVGPWPSVLAGPPVQEFPAPVLPAAVPRP